MRGASRGGYGRGRARGGDGFQSAEFDSAGPRAARGGFQSHGAVARRAAQEPAQQEIPNAPKPNSKPVAPTGGQSERDLMKGERFEREAAALVSRLRAAATTTPGTPLSAPGNSPLTPASARTPVSASSPGDSQPSPSSSTPTTTRPLSDDERKRLAELLLLLLEKYPRHAAHIGAVHVLWSTFFVQRVKAAEKALLHALDDVETSKPEELVEAGKGGQAAATWRRWRETRRAFRAELGGIASRFMGIANGLKQFVNTADGRRLAARAYLCLGDLARYEDRAEAKAYDAAVRLADRAGRDRLDVLELFDLEPRGDVHALARLRRSAEFYRDARSLTPAHGPVYNAIGIVHDTGRADPFQAAYAYVRAATAPEKPFVAAEVSLANLAAAMQPALPLEEELMRLSDAGEHAANAVALATMDEDEADGAFGSPGASPTSADPSDLYTPCAAVLVTVINAGARGQRTPGLLGGPVLRMTLNRLLRAKQTAPSERLLIRAAIAAILADDIQDTARQKRQKAALKRYAPCDAAGDDAAAAAATAARQGHAAPGQAALALFRAFIDLVVRSEPAFASHLLRETDIAAGLSIIVAAWPLQGDFGRLLSAVPTVDRNALVGRIAQAALSLKLNVRDPSIAVALTTGEGGGLVAPEDDELDGVKPDVLARIAHRLACAAPPVEGAGPSTADYRRFRDGGLSRPLLGGADLTRLRLRRLLVLLERDEDELADQWAAGSRPQSAHVAAPGRPQSVTSGMSPIGTEATHEPDAMTDRASSVAQTPLLHPSVRQSSMHGSVTDVAALSLGPTVLSHVDAANGSLTREPALWGNSPAGGYAGWPSGGTPPFAAPAPAVPSPFEFHPAPQQPQPHAQRAAVQPTTVRPVAARANDDDDEGDIVVMTDFAADWY